MWLYVMRHGPAEDQAPSGRDYDRALTPVGRETVSRSCAALKKVHEALPGPPPIRILTSPFRRARETADLIQAALGTDPDVEVTHELGADGGSIEALARATAAPGTAMVLVGHQPFVEELVRALLGITRGARAPLPHGFRTALVVALESEDGATWRVRDLLDPHLPPK